MSKTYLTVASHWDTPGIRQYASTERVHAERKAAELVDELIDMFADDFKDEIAASKGMLAVPPKVAEGGNDWEATLRALQLARLIENTGGEGEANDALYHFCCTMRAEEEPPLIGEGFPPALQDVIERFVAEDDCDPDKIGFPMVWIEEVDAAEPEAEVADAAHAQEIERQEIASGAYGDGPFKRGLARDAAPADEAKPEWTVGEFGPAFVPGSAVNSSSLTLGDILSVCGFASSHVNDWIEDAPNNGIEANGGGDVERAAAAAALIEKVELLAPLMFAQPSVAVDPAEPITIAVTIEGGVMQGSVASGEGVRLYVVDFDQDGVEQGRLVDMAGPYDTREEWASVWQDNTTVDAAEVARIIAKAEEGALREQRFNNNECLSCGTDLDSPSAAGAEDGICGECCSADSGGRRV